VKADRLLGGGGGGPTVKVGVLGGGLERSHPTDQFQRGSHAFLCTPTGGAKNETREKNPQLRNPKNPCAKFLKKSPPKVSLEVEKGVLNRGRKRRGGKKWAAQLSTACSNGQRKVANDHTHSLRGALKKGGKTIRAESRKF